MMPGTTPAAVNTKTMRNEPHPLSITARGGKNIANNALSSDIAFRDLVAVVVYQRHKPLVTKGTR